MNNRLAVVIAFGSCLLLCGCFGLRAERMVTRLETGFPVGSDAISLRTELRKLEFSDAPNVATELRESGLFEALPAAPMACFDRRPPNLGGSMIACFTEDAQGRVTWRYFENLGYW